MKLKHNCLDYLELDHIVDTLLPYGDIESNAVFRCRICGREFNEEEINGRTFLDNKGNIRAL